MVKKVTRRGFTPALAAVCAVLGVLLVAAWYGSVRADPDSRSVEADPADSPRDLEPWAGHALAVYEAWAGTPSEHRAAEVVAAHRLNEGFAECMENRGYLRSWHEVVSQAPVPKDPLLYSFWAAGRLDGYYSQKVINGEMGQRVELTENAYEASGDEAAAEQTCREHNPGASDDEVGEIRDPAVVRGLIKAWTESLAPVLMTGGDLAVYDECMATSGALEKLGVNSPDEARQNLSALLPAGSVPLGKEVTTPEWEAYLVDERTFVDADWECREDTRSDLGDEVEQAVTSFEDEYVAEIAAARDHWDSIQEQAEELSESSPE